MARRVVHLSCVLSAIVMVFVVLSLALPLAAQTSAITDPLSVRPQDRVTSLIDDQQRVTLTGNHHPLARPENEAGAVSPDMRMDRMILSLRPEASQQAALQALLKAQQDPASPYYHQWLTPDTYAESFGVSENDARQVAKWLQAHGMEVEEIAPGRTAIVFSGTAAQVEEAFQTPIRLYQAQGQLHYANSADPQIPQALATVVNGPVALHDFRSSPALVNAAPGFTAGNGAHFLAPADWVTIYDVGPLYSQGLDGTGQSIAVLGRVDVSLTDVQNFRRNSGLPAINPEIIVNGSDPGNPDCDDDMESALDVEWAGAIAKKATIKFVTSKSTTTDGIDLSAQYAVSHKVAPIITLSYGQCEAALGPAANAFWNGLWSQAALQGQTVFVSSMDNGAAGCDDPNETTATQGQAVSGLCSTAFNTCVGGTEFDDTSNPSFYWAATDGAGMGSALSYIPESAWNESGLDNGTGLWASAGGVSTLYPKPSWQAAPGVPADGYRDIPDMAMAAAGHDAYLAQLQGSQAYVGGTSAATPSMASVMALVLQANNGTAQGNINPVLYGLANLQLSDGGTAIFHDITSGNNSVPGQVGFSAGVGYDQVTGLGSVDAQLLVNHWHDADASANFQLNATSSSLTIAVGNMGTVTLNVTVSGGFSAPISMSVKGLPAKLTGTFTAATLSAPGSGTTILMLTATTGVQPGTYPLIISATSGSITRVADVSVTVGTAPGLTLKPAVDEISLPAGTTGHITVTTLATGGFKAPVTLAVSGMPMSMTANFSPSSIASPGSGSSTLIVVPEAGMAHGNYALTLTATGGGLTETATLMVDVPNFALAASAQSINVTPSGSGEVTLTTVPVSGFDAAVAFSVSELPAGVSASFSPSSIAAPGYGTSLLTFTVTSKALKGTYAPRVKVTGGGITHSAILTLNIVPAPTFSMLASATSVSILPGKSASLTFTTAAADGFNSLIGFELGGILPTGASAAFVPSTIAAPGSGKTTLTINIPANAAAASYTLTVTASGGNVTQVAAVTLNIPSFLLNMTAGTIINAGGSIPLALDTVPVGGFDAAIALSVSGLPSGVTGKFSPSTIAAPGGGISTLNLSTTSSMAGGQWTPVVTATGGGITKTATFSLTVDVPGSFAFNQSKSFLTIPAGSSGQETVTSTISGSFNSSLTLSASSVPAGVTVTFSPASIAAPGAGTSTVTVAVGSSVASGTYDIVLTAIGPKSSQGVTLQVNVPNVTVTLSSSSLTFTHGGSGSITVTTQGIGSFSSAVTLAATGLPQGVTAAFSPAAIPAPGSGSSTLTLTSTSSTLSGMYVLTVNAVGNGVTNSASIPLTIQ
jgi:subtilase family serine protease